MTVLLSRFWPHLIAFALGAWAAVAVQEIRIERIEQEFTEYKQSIKAQELRHESAAIQARQEAAVEYAAQQGVLNHEIEQGIVYRRCVAAGKCGVRQPTACSPSLRLPSIGGIDATGSDAISVIAGATAESSEAPEVVNDCAITTLRLNRLQAEIEGQEGY